ncbi:MAG: lipocalin family protein [Candidatus Wenzhouxiangella sp. M2_3B_020]
MKISMNPFRRSIPVLLCALAWTLLPMTAAADRPLELVDDVDLVRYQGLWYEIALLPNEFQEQCVGETTAEYTLLENGRIRVVNRCRTAGGEFDQVVGRARRPDPDQPAKLEVRFAPGWLGWLPFVWGDYQVMALDDDYRWAMVGAPSREFLWILAREPNLPEARIEALLDEARSQGFDSDAVERTPQDWP